MDTAFIPEFKHHALYRLNESTRMVNKCLSKLSDEEIWKKPNSSSNTIGNLILHLAGNIRQYAVSSLGNIEDSRDRNSEFNGAKMLPKADLLGQLTRTIEKAKDTIQRASVEELIRKRPVQGFDLSGVGIIIHVVEHYSYHTGQIALITKLWKNVDLGFYDGLDLNIKNE